VSSGYFIFFLFATYCSGLSELAYLSLCRERRLLCSSSIIIRCVYFILEQTYLTIIFRQHRINRRQLLQWRSKVSFDKTRQNVVPAELCQVRPGQICNIIPDELRPDMVQFSTMKPNACKQRIVEEVCLKKLGIDS
jgi:hypothetical protein